MFQNIIVYLRCDWLEDLSVRQLENHPADLSDDQSADKLISRLADKSVKRQADMEAGKPDD